MEEGDEMPLTNLRVIGTIQDGKYPTTDRDGNFIDAFDNTYFNSIISSIGLENWASTQFCLRKLYTLQLPVLIAKLIEDQDELELQKLQALIGASQLGLRAIKKLYPHNNQRQAWMDTIMLDYATNQVVTITNYFKEKNLCRAIDGSDASQTDLSVGDT